MDYEMKIKQIHYRIRLFGGILALILIQLSEYHDNDYLLVPLTLGFLGIATWIRFGKFSEEKGVRVNKMAFYMDVLVLSAGIGIRGGLRSDFYIGYYVILGYVIHMKDRYLVYKLVALIVASYSLVVFNFGQPGDISVLRLVIRLALITGAAVVFRIYVGIMLHLDQQKQDAEHMAVKDALTHVYNRNVLNEYYIDEQKYKKVSHCAMIDIDDFKVINDTHGHISGDMVLKVLANILDGDAFFEATCIRYGGEEFLLLIKGSTDHQVMETLNRYRQMLGAVVFDWQSTKDYLTFTAGVAKVADGDSLEDVIRKADIALYEGKRSGKSKVIFFQEK